MRRVVLRPGGNVICPRTTDRIDDEFISAFITYVARNLVHSYDRVVVVPGGVGGEQLFMRWGRQAGCTEAQLNEIGCTLINMSAAILRSAFRKHLENATCVCPIVPRTLEELDQAVDRYTIVVAGCAISHAITSDSLAALMAEHFDAHLRLIKSAKPFSDATNVYLDAEQQTLSLSRLLAYYGTLPEPEVAGHHPSIDHLCLRIIRRSHLNAAIILKSDVIHWTVGGANHPAIDILDDLASGSDISSAS